MRIVKVLNFSIVTVTAAGVNLTCPAFRNGEKAVFDCKINKTAIDNAGCLTPKKNVTFDWTLKTTLTKCSTLSPALADCKQQEPTTPSSCWCDKADDEIFWYKFSYVVNEARDLGALLECKYCNLPHDNQSATDSDSCTIKNFGLCQHIYFLKFV